MGNITKIRLKGDGVIWFIFFCLCVISVVEVYSATSTLSFKNGQYWAPALGHVKFILAGFILTIVTMMIPCKYFKPLSVTLYFLSLVLLVLVLLVGKSTNDAARWFSIMGVRFQPSELVKGAMVMVMAMVISAKQTEGMIHRSAFRLLLGIMAGPVVLIFTENLSTAVLICIVGMMMMWIGKVPFRQWRWLMFAGIALVAVVLIGVMTLGDAERAEREALEKKESQRQLNDVKPKKDVTFAEKILHRADAWKTRLVKFSDKSEIAPEDVDLDEDAQTSHAMIAYASSNVIGRMPGNSIERDFLPQAYSDFIYAIIYEELGIVGASLVCFLYVVLLFRCLDIAKRCVNIYPALVIMGIALLMVTQAMFNMAVAVGFLPVTGQTLPLVSRGGTSMLVNCVNMGIILSVSWSAQKVKKGEGKNAAQPALAKGDIAE